MGSRIQINITDRGFQVPCLWEIVSEVRCQVSKRLSAFSTDMRDSAGLVAGELVENMVKYSADADGIPSNLKLNITDKMVEVCSSNGVDPSQARSVIEVLDSIAAHLDPVQLYAAVIEASLGENTESTRQGFYRIAAVTGFSLNAVCQGNVLTITARREI